MGLILIETGDPRGRDGEAFLEICRAAGTNRNSLAICRDRTSPAGPVPPACGPLPSDSPVATISFPLDDDDLASLAGHLGEPIAFLPADGTWTVPEFARLRKHDNAVLPWGIAPAPASRTSQLSEQPVAGWVMSAPLALPLLRSAAAVADLRLPAVVGRIRESDLAVEWLSARIELSGRQPVPGPGPRGEPAIRSGAKVLALVPHYRCEDWLKPCLASLAGQTRPPDAIVVIDDASTEPPIDLCRAFPDITLLRARERVGPYRLVQSVIGRTSFDAYLFQDADDWSARDRLELLLESAEHVGAELIGCQQLRLLHDTGSMHTMTFPLDVNWGLAEGPANGLAHPTSLAARRFLLRSGGFSSGMRFGGDTEFLHRAVLSGRVMNTPYLSYFWRGRPTSLSNSAQTGRTSPLRQKMWQTLYRHYRAALQDRKEGRSPSLAPLCPGEPIELIHLAGPRPW